ncbi:MAG: beta-propeller fold lactonase family protein [Myxococcales bacterium]|nr:beta-propeller fold lactonase family protein [Myxococcales bacterium]
MDSPSQVLVIGITFLSIQYSPMRPGAAQSLERVTVIREAMTPKSVGHNGQGLFFVQNMMYRHSIDVYDRAFNLVRRIKDNVVLSKFGYKDVSGQYKGSPVEVAFSRNGQWAWVSNYAMQGRGFDHPGIDKCKDDRAYDHSFVYQINTRTFRITDAIAVGSVPKYLTVTPNDRYLLVSNWCSDTLSVVSTRRNEQIQQIQVGKHPRGIVVSPDSRTAYVALMGAGRIAQVDLKHGTVDHFPAGGPTPRHLQISPDGHALYVSLSQPGKVIRIDLRSRRVTNLVRSGAVTRGMALSPDGKYLYAANYRDNSLTKIYVPTFQVMERSPTPAKPIGLTIDEDTGYIWVACYSGSLAIYKDHRQPPRPRFLDDETYGDSLHADASSHREETGRPHQSAEDELPRHPTYPWLMAQGPFREQEPMSEPPSVAQRDPNSGRLPSLSDEYGLEKPINGNGSYIIIASFRLQKYAKRYAEQLKDRGYRAGILESRKHFFRVYVGYTPSREEALQQLPRLRSRLNRSAWVYTKQ